MYRPERSSNDPFETLVELTAAVVSRRPPPEHVYEPVGIPLHDRLAGFLDGVFLHDDEGAANDAQTRQYEELHRYYY